MPDSVVTQDADGRITVKANKLEAPLIVDGRLDEAVYASVPAISDFIQQEPLEGQPATEKTEVWVFFDQRNMYVSARCWDSHPERDVSNEMRRDSVSIFDNELFGVSFDTFHDQRNGYIFIADLAGGLFDAYITDERDFNRDWNTVWDARTARFDGGWTVEIAIPFKSLRYNPTTSQVWGVNFRRAIRWKNESDYLTRIPAAMGRRGMNKISSSATLVGVVPPNTRRNFEIKPYGIADVTTDRTASPPISHALGKDIGVDVKVGLVRGLTADVTYNTDFAQVEVDEQQLNLTRFNVFFPERRDFFLEGQGIFGFGGVQNSPRTGVGPGGTNNTNPSPADMPNLFFSRRIGLTGGHKVPIDVGARVTGKAGPYSIGLLDIRTGNEPSFGLLPTNFGVVRVKRDLLRRSAVGVLYTDRSLSSTGSGANRLFGVDGVFSFYQNLAINTYIAKTSSEGTSGNDVSYRAQLDYNADRYGLQLEQIFLDDNFNPDVGFVRRQAFRRSSAFARFSPRPRSNRAVRRFNWDGTFDYVTDPSGHLQSRYVEAGFRPELDNGDTLAVEYASSYEFLPKPFAVNGNVTIPVGGYSFPEFRAMYYFGGQRAASGVVKVSRGSFYSGRRTELTVYRSRLGLTGRLAMEPGATINWVTLPQGSFRTALLSLRTTLTLSPRAMIAALIQNTSTTRTLGANIRFQWEFEPGSFFYVVYNDNRNTKISGFPLLESRSIVVKFTRLFRL